jgi:hypothetical protein
MTVQQNEAYAQFQLEFLDEYIAGENIYKTSEYAAKNPVEYATFHADKAPKFGLEKTKANTPRKYHQLTAANVLRSAGENVPHYNGAIIDGQAYVDAIANVKEFTSERYMAWMMASFIRYQSGFNIYKSGESRDDNSFRFVDGDIQDYNKLRNLHEDETTYFDMIAFQIANVFKPLIKMLDNPMFNTPDAVGEFDRIVEDVTYHDLRGKRCVPKPLLAKLTKDATILNYDNLENYSTILIGNKLALNIRQNANGTYNVKNVLNGQIVATYPSIAYIKAILFGIATGLKKTLLAGMKAPKILVLPAEHRFV